MSLSNTFTISCELVFSMTERRTVFERSRTLIEGSPAEIRVEWINAEVYCFSLPDNHRNL
jgi:hypothetical protein